MPPKSKKRKTSAGKQPEARSEGEIQPASPTRPDDDERRRSAGQAAEPVSLRGG